MGRDELSVYADRRPAMTEADRHAMKARRTSHLPNPKDVVQVSDDDLNAMRAAFIARFNEDLPRTETLMAVSMIGYRMALRDNAKAIKALTAQLAEARKSERAAVAQYVSYLDPDLADKIEAGGHLT